MVVGGLSVTVHAGTDAAYRALLLSAIECELARVVSARVVHRALTRREDTR